jgi:negative regulator of flagellin synthesis FlgM
MRINTPGLPNLTTTTGTNDKPTASAATGSSSAQPLESSVLQPALAALRDLPDIDQSKVDALRDALARGEVPLNTDRLAGLIARYHGGRK